MRKTLSLLIILIFIFSVTSVFSAQTNIAHPPQAIEKGNISGEITRINKPDMTITVQNPTQGMEILVTAKQMRGLEVGDRVMVQYIMKEGKARAIKITKLPGMQPQPLNKPK